MERIHPLTAFVRRLDGEFYTRYELAQALSVAPEYLIQIRRTHPELAPSVIVNYRGRPLRLYDREDANRLARYFKDHEQVGEPRRHSMAVVAARAKLWGRIRSYRRRAHNARDEVQRARLLGMAEKLAAERSAL
jgi:hypothetical protein